MPSSSERRPVLLGVDGGTTYCKAGLIGSDGSVLQLASRPTPTDRTSEGFFAHDPDRLWLAVAAAIREVMSLAAPVRVEAVGIGSMAEAGLLVDRHTGGALTDVLPWFDTRSHAQADEIAAEDTPLSLFQRSGLHPSFKYGLAKLLWLREHTPADFRNAVWLSVADYISLRLTGRMVTDPTLAVRTFAFRIREGVWDEAWIRHFGFEPAVFPRVEPSGSPSSLVSPDGAAATGLREGVRVAVCGHDHLCAAVAAGVIVPGPVLDSVGTAESMLGVLQELRLREAEWRSGLAVVPHVLPGRYCWLGGLSAAGGSVEWLRRQLADEPVSYEEIMRLVGTSDPAPTGILFFPYLSGSGAPYPDRRVRAAFVGLSGSHGRADLVRAVLEGTAYEAESLRRAAEALTGQAVHRIIVVGGATRNPVWMQIKADVYGCTLVIPNIGEATVLGAALMAGLGCGVMEGENEIEAIAGRCRVAGSAVSPDSARHERYRTLYEDGYVGFQSALRGWHYHD